MFNEILQKSIAGFFFGLGAAIAAILMIFIYDSYRHEMKGWFGNTYVHYWKENNPGLEILNHKKRDDAEIYTIVGNITNKGKIPLKDIEIAGRVKDGEYVLGSCNGYVEGGQYLNPNETSFFIVKCHELKTSENPYPYTLYFNSAIGYE